MTEANALKNRAAQKKFDNLKDKMETEFSNINKHITEKDNVIDALNNQIDSLLEDSRKECERQNLKINTKSKKMQQVLRTKEHSYNSRISSLSSKMRNYSEKICNLENDNAELSEKLALLEGDLYADISKLEDITAEAKHLEIMVQKAEEDLFTTQQKLIKRELDFQKEMQKIQKQRMNWKL